MKNLLKLLSCLFFAALLVISSCVKETFTEEDAYAEQRKNVMLQDSVERSKMELEQKLTQSQLLLIDSLKKVGGVINYSVAVVNASESSWWSNYFFGFDKGKGETSEQAVSGAAVTVAQHGRLFTATTDASGIASFSDLRIGTANVSINMTGYTSVDFVVEMPPLTENFHSSVVTRVDNYEYNDESASVTDSTTQNIKDLVRHVATMIPIFSTTNNLSHIRGVATVESDLTNEGPEVAAGVRVYGVIDVYDDYFWANYMYQPEITNYWECDLCGYRTKFDYYGKVKQIAFGSTVSSAITGTNGSFDLTVPSTPQGLPIHIEVDQFALDQTLLMPALYGEPVTGLQQVRTLFGGDDFSASYDPIPNLGMTAMNVQSAYVEFSAPNGVPAAQPTTEATATAVLGNSGIASVNITNPGSGYTQPPVVEFSLGAGFNAVKAEGTAEIANGRITGVTITNPGSGYLPNSSPTITFKESVIEEASFDPEFSFSVVDIDIDSYGSGYGQTPPNVTITGSGTGATAHVVMNADIKEINMTAMGSGYSQAPQVVISDNFGAREEATAIMTTNNPLLSITYKGGTPAGWLYPASPIPTATITGNGTAATATVTLSTVGKVMSATVGAGGSGYTSAPIVSIVGGGGFGATATAVMTADAVSAITITDPGQGYTSIPTITFTGGNGSGAVAAAVLGFPVQSIALNAAGIGYSSVTAITLSNGTPALDHNFLPYCDVKFNKSVRSVSFSDNGWHFSGTPAVTFNTVDGLGSGAAATAVVEWWIDDILVDNQGSGYKEDDFNDILVRIDPPSSGTQATATATLGNGILASVKLVNAGEGYTAVPNVYLVDSDGGVAGPVNQAELTATVNNGHVTGLTISEAGTGYDYDAAMDGDYYIDISTFDPATPAAATAVPNPESGKIAYISVTNGGAGYSVAPVIEIYNDSQGDANGFGTGATATAVVVDGRITGINVTNAGSGYYVAPTVRINVVSSVMTALGRCVVSADGRITGVNFDNPGEEWGARFTRGYGYTTAPTVAFFPSIPGKGAGATGIAQINDGSITNVIMTNQGSGYIGRNKPMRQYFSITEDDLYCKAAKSYIVDIYFGTGKRTVTERGAF